MVHKCSFVQVVINLRAFEPRIHVIGGACLAWLSFFLDTCPLSCFRLRKTCVSPPLLMAMICVPL